LFVKVRGVSLRSRLPSLLAPPHLVKGKTGVLEDVTKANSGPGSVSDGSCDPVGRAKSGNAGVDEVIVLAAVSVALNHGGHVNLFESIAILELVEGDDLLLASNAPHGQPVLVRLDVRYKSVVANVVLSCGGEEAISEVAQTALSIVGVTGVGEEGVVGWRVVLVRVVELWSAKTLNFGLVVAKAPDLVTLQVLEDVTAVVLGVDLPEGL